MSVSTVSPKKMEAVVCPVAPDFATCSSFVPLSPVHRAVAGNGDQAVAWNGDQTVAGNGDQAVAWTGDQAVVWNVDQAVAWNGDQVVVWNSGFDGRWR